MGPPLLAGKLSPPQPRSSWVTRERLLQRLGRATELPLTLVSAPAGFGKSTVLAEWVAGVAAAGTPCAWLALDERDDERWQFWRYVVAAIGAATGGRVGAAAAAALEARAPQVDLVLIDLVNELQTVERLVVVLDDLHLVPSPQIRDDLERLLAELPPSVHLVLATRTDPALPLGRLRASGDLLELRAADLRFTPAEAATYLNDVTGRRLTAAQVATLEQRTEGWIAALQLAALSMRDRDDVAGFIAGFAGDDRFVVDYLAEEVLARQTPELRAFLLSTSVLDRLTASLCDAVTGGSDSRAVLAQLERANLFLTQLDDRREWYRYHQLFAEVLRAHLHHERPDDVAGLHQRAAEWYAAGGLPSEGIRHALAAGEVEHAAELAEVAMPGLQRDRREVEIRSWLEQFPAELVARRPVLGIGFVGALMSVNDFERVPPVLTQVEQALAGDPDDRVVVDAEQFRQLPGLVELYRAGLALVTGDPAGVVEHGRRAIDLAAPEDHVCRAGAAALMGLASWAAGDLDHAFASYAEGMAGLERAGWVSDVLGCAVSMADIRIDQGRLTDAVEVYRRAIMLVPEHERTSLRGTADVLVGLGGLHWERHEVDQAHDQLDRAEALGDLRGLPKNASRRRILAARVRLAAGDTDGAVGLLDDAERLYVADFAPDVRPIAAMRARVLAQHGRLDEALRWVRERGLSVDDELSYLHEFEHLSLVVVLLARHEKERDPASLADAVRLLARLLPAAEAGARTGRVVEILALRALAQQAAGDHEAALSSLGLAVERAEPEGQVRVLADLGPPMTALLRQLSRRRVAPGHVRRILAATSAVVPAPPVGGSSRTMLVEPLSSRESDVLRLLGSELTGPEIARELVVSLNTVRTHTRNVYAKLGVTSRRAAVRRGRELELI